MTSKEILRSDFLDILFENRNKLYGAYLLRKNYNKRLLISLLATFVLMLPLYFIFRNTGDKIQSAAQENIVIIRDVIFPKVEKPKDAKPSETQQTQRTKNVQASTQAFVNNIEIVDREVMQPMLPQTELVNISDMTRAGSNIPLPYAPSLPTEYSGVLKQKQEAVEAPIQKEPEFPGGMQAWIQFLRDHLQVPGSLEPGERKTVQIRFLVSETGMVTGFEVVKSAGRMYDNEVIRVLKRMPKWKPAIQNNQPVSRSFTQPVTFVGLEE